MTDAVLIVPVEGGLRYANILGGTKVLENVRLVEVNLLRHRVIIERD